MNCNPICHGVPNSLIPNSRTHINHIHSVKYVELSTSPTLSNPKFKRKNVNIQLYSTSDFLNQTPLKFNLLQLHIERGFSLTSLSFMYLVHHHRIHWHLAPQFPYWLQEKSRLVIYGQRTKKYSLEQKSLITLTQSIIDKIQ